jgi:hypothetical protein
MYALSISDLECLHGIKQEFIVIIMLYLSLVVHVLYYICLIFVCLSGSFFSSLKHDVVHVTKEPYHVISFFRVRTPPST